MPKNTTILFVQQLLKYPRNLIFLITRAASFLISLTSLVGALIVFCIFSFGFGFLKPVQFFQKQKPSSGVVDQLDLAANLVDEKKHSNTSSLSKAKLYFIRRTMISLCLADIVVSFSFSVYCTTKN